MASVSSSAARSLLRDGKSAVNLLLRARTANLTETVQNINGSAAIRSLLRLNQTPASQYPVFPETFPVMQTGLRVGVVQEEDVSKRIGKMEEAHGKRVVEKNKEVDTEEEEEETDFDEDEIDDVDIDEDDEEFDDIDEDDDDDEEEEEPSRHTRKKN